MERSYEWAIRLLNGRKARAKQNLNDMRGSDDMLKWLEMIGYSMNDLKDLRIIHVAGTKGKGSTCSFASSLFLSHGKRNGYPNKIGLYTSPHMKSIRERIRINDKPISEELFTSRFFEVWDKLPLQATPLLDIPRYLQLLTLTSYHVFITENVDAAIYETHLGGEFDATNIVNHPIVTAVTPIALDHVSLLGPTIEKVTWHKAGIFKPGSLAFSSSQPPAVVAILEKRAVEREVVLEIVGIDPTLPISAPSLKPTVQRQNFSLALAVVRAWLRVVPKAQSSLTADDIVKGVENFRWPGRFQKITEGQVEWFLDGAHNELSIQHAVLWYAEATLRNRVNKTPPVRILIFSHFSERDGVALLRSLAKSLQESAVQIHQVIFTSYDERRDGITRIDRNLQNRFKPEVQACYVETWHSIDPKATILTERTIEEALDRARKIGQPHCDIHALITGSLHLVSGALCLLESDDGVHLP